MFTFEIGSRFLFSYVRGALTFLYPWQGSSSGVDNDEEEKEILHINAKSAIVFVVTASAFLLLLYFFMSSWFIWLLIVLFCIGGIEVNISYF